jgi:hypothetical protein
VLLLVRRLRLRIITGCRIAPESPARSISQWAEPIELLDQNAVGSRCFFREDWASHLSLRLECPFVRVEPVLPFY